MSKLVWVCGVIFVVLVLDQGTKWYVEQTFDKHELLPVISGFFNLTRTYNYGAAFGLFAGLADGTREIVLLGTAFVALAVVAYFLRHPHYQGRLAQTSLALVLGGAAGNLIDRFSRGAVVDFLDFYVGSYHWPAFNVADSAICTGVALLLLVPAKKDRSEQEELLAS